MSEQAGSGRTVAEFCRDRGIRKAQFFAWRKRLSGNVESFVEVQVVPTARPIEIRLGEGRSILVEPGFDPAHLRAVLAALEARV